MKANISKKECGAHSSGKQKGAFIRSQMSETKDFLELLELSREHANMAALSGDIVKTCCWQFLLHPKPPPPDVSQAGINFRGEGLSQLLVQLHTKPYMTLETRWEESLLLWLLFPPLHLFQIQGLKCLPLHPVLTMKGFLPLACLFPSSLLLLLPLSLPPLPPLIHNHHDPGCEPSSSATCLVGSLAGASHHFYSSSQSLTCNEHACVKTSP